MTSNKVKNAEQVQKLSWKMYICRKIAEKDKYDTK